MLPRKCIFANMKFGYSLMHNALNRIFPKNLSMVKNDYLHLMLFKHQEK